MDSPPSSSILPQASQLSLTVVGTCLAAVALLSLHITRTLSAPLSALPGTFVSKWTTLPLRFATAFGERRRYVHALHARYGPIIRLSPSEVSVTDIGAVKQLYKMGSRFHKSPWYVDFTGASLHGELSMFNMIDDTAHAGRRRLVAHQFTERAVRTLEPGVVAKNTRLTAEGMAREMEQKGFVDVFKWFAFMANDVVCEASFAESFGLLKEGKSNSYITDIINFTELSMFRTQLPLINRALALLNPKDRGSSMRIFQRLGEYSGASFARYERHLRSQPDEARPTLLSKLFASTDGDGGLTRDQIRREGVGYILAGTDTTANAATYAVWLLERHPEHERRVRDEVAALPRDFADEQLLRLPALCNALSEVLRLRSPVGQGLPRTVSPEGVTLAGYFVPGGAGIAAPAWTLHRDPKVWEAPEEFRPERWEGVTREMREHYLPWGGGNRTCIGMHLAQMELRHALANFYRVFPSGVKMSDAEGFSEKEMEPVSYFVMAPRGKRLLVERR